MAPTVVHCVRSLPPEGAIAPAVWRSQSRGPGLTECRDFPGPI